MPTRLSLLLSQITAVALSHPDFYRWKRLTSLAPVDAVVDGRLGGGVDPVLGVGPPVNDDLGLALRFGQHREEGHPRVHLAF